VTAPLLWWLASWLLRLYCAVARPRELTCPPHTWLPNGIRPSGEFACAPALTGDVRRDGAGGTRDDSVQPEGEIGGRIWCAAGEQAVVMGERRVGCEAVRS
jgi:hypothetical protein